MSLLKKLAGETAIYGLSSIVGRFLNFLLVPLYTRQFTPGEYGVVSELYAYSGFLMVLFSYRLESAFFRYGTDEKEGNSVYSTALLALVGSSVFLLLAIFVFTPEISSTLGYTAHPEYIRCFALILALECLSELPFARLRLEQRPKRFVAAKLVNIGLNIVLNLFWVVFCPWMFAHGFTWVRIVWSPDVGVGFVFLSNLLASLATLLFLLSEIRKMQFQFDVERWKKMMRYAGPLVIVGFAGVINEMLDRAMLKQLLPGTPAENLAQLGIYSANYKLAMLITLCTQAYRYAAEPFFFRNAEGKDALQLQANAAKWFTIAGSAAILGILLFLDLFKHFIGVKFHSGLKVVPVLLLANLFLGIYYNFSVWYRLKDRTMTGAWIGIAGAGITILLNLWWAPVLGYMGAAWATLVCYFFMASATWWTGRMLHPVPYSLGKMAFFIVLAFSLFGLSEWIKPMIDHRFIRLTVNAFLMLPFLLAAYREFSES